MCGLGVATGLLPHGSYAVPFEFVVFVWYKSPFYYPKKYLGASGQGAEVIFSVGGCSTFPTPVIVNQNQ